MKKCMVVLAMLAAAAAQSEGYAIYKQKCAACHNEMKTLAEVQKNLAALKAPPIMEVSNRLKRMIQVSGGDEELKRELVLTFMRDYIINPDIDKSFCNLGAIDRFGVMPSQKGNLTPEEILQVTEWVYDNFEGKAFK